MHYLGKRSLACLIVCMSAQAFSMDFNGMRVEGGWPTAFLRARADWSSELGLDYQCGYGDDGLGNAVGWGEGSFSTSRNVRMEDAGFWAGWELDRRGGEAGQTFSGGRVDVSPGGPGSSWTSSWHMYSELGANNIGHGISTDSYAGTYYSFVPASGEQVYWAMDWTLTVSTEGRTFGSAWLNGLTYRNGGAGPTRTLISEWLNPGTTTITGSDSGGPSNYGYSGRILPNFEIGTHLHDDAGISGEGRMDLVVNITFSTSPVPEPSSCLALVCGCLVLIRRRLSNSELVATRANPEAD